MQRARAYSEATVATHKTYRCVIQHLQLVDGVITAAQPDVVQQRLLFLAFQIGMDTGDVTQLTTTSDEVISNRLGSAIVPRDWGSTTPTQHIRQNGCANCLCTIVNPACLSCPIQNRHRGSATPPQLSTAGAVVAETWNVIKQRSTEGYYLLRRWKLPVSGCRARPTLSGVDEFRAQCDKCETANKC